MCKSTKGGAGAVAYMLGMSLDQLNNRIYEKKNQRVSVDLALEIQHVTESSGFAKYIAKQSGGIFVKLPDCGTIEEEDIQKSAMYAIEKMGTLMEQYRVFTEDGVLDSQEQKQMMHTKSELFASVTTMLLYIVKTFSVDSLDNDMEGKEQ